MLRCLLVAALLVCTATICFGQASPLMLFSRLTVNQTHIAFSYAGDLWIVDRAGGEARRLTNHPAEENFPAFSPDGSQLGHPEGLDSWTRPPTGKGRAGWLGRTEESAALDTEEAEVSGA
jgi:tricorn protease